MQKRALIIAGALAFCLAPACSRESPYESTSRRAGDAPAGGQIAAGTIAKQPDQFYGRQVNVKAEVEEVYSGNIFTLDEDSLAAATDVLVLAPRITTVNDDSTVIVHGTVRPMVVSEIQKQYSWFDPKSLGPDVVAKLKDRPVIIADSIRTAEGRDLLTPGGTTAGDAPVGGLGVPPQQNRGTDTDEANPANLPNQPPPAMQ